MNERTKMGLEILTVAVILGVLGDILLRVTPWGLNVTLFNLTFAAGMIGLLRRYKAEYLTRQTLALFGALVFFASMFAWRDSIELRIADSVAILAVLSALFLPRMKLQTQFAGVFHYIVGFVWAGFNAMFTPFALVFSDIEWANIERTGFSKHLFSVLRGVAIAAPILLIFGGLFVAADAVYQGWVQRIFDVIPETVFTHVLLTSIVAWLSAGYLRGVIIIKLTETEAKPETETAKADPNLSPVDNMHAEIGESASNLTNNLSILEHINRSDPPNKKEGPKIAEQKWEWAKLENTIMPPAFTLGTVEVGVILGLINLLFLSFVVVQVPYLFGGMELVQNTPDFKLAEYARRGFGELVAVSALVLPILLASHWLIRKETPVTEKLFRVLAGVQIALLFVIMASAAQRLFLLTGNLGYGLTTIRLYPMIFMTWLAIVFVWFGWTVLRGGRKHFAWGALWSVFFILGATHVLNPDAFIVRANVRLMKEGRVFDSFYNANLSDDAIPALLESIPAMNFDQQCAFKAHLSHRLILESGERDMRSWNWSRSRAIYEIRENLANLDTTGCPQNGGPWPGFTGDP